MKTGRNSQKGGWGGGIPKFPKYPVLSLSQSCLTCHLVLSWRLLLLHPRILLVHPHHGQRRDTHPVQRVGSVSWKPTRWETRNQNFAGWQKKFHCHFSLYYLTLCCCLIRKRMENLQRAMLRKRKEDECAEPRSWACRGELLPLLLLGSLSQDCHRYCTLLLPDNASSHII